MIDHLTRIPPPPPRTVDIEPDEATDDGGWTGQPLTRSAGFAWEPRRHPVPTIGRDGHLRSADGTRVRRGRKR